MKGSCPLFIPSMTPVGRNKDTCHRDFSPKDSDALMQLARAGWACCSPALKVSAGHFFESGCGVERNSKERLLTNSLQPEFKRPREPTGG
jgi:hypothetical protein